MDDLLQTQIKEICRLNMPEGLKELMSDISREVLLAQPTDIYGFIANYLSALLVTRDNLSIASQICTHVCECDCRPELIRELKDIGLSDTDAEIAQNVILKYFAKKKVNEGNLLVALLRQTAIDDTMFPAITEAIRAAYLSHQAHEYTKYESSSESDQDEVASAAAHTLNIYRETRPAEEAYGEMTEKIQTSYRAYGVQRSFTTKPDHLRIAQFPITSPGSSFSEDVKKEMEITTSMNNKRMNTVSSFSLAGSLYNLPKHAPYNAHDDDSLSALEKISEKEHAHIDYTARSPHVSVVSEKRTIISGPKKRISFQNDSEEEIHRIKQPVDKQQDSIDEKVDIDEDKLTLEADDDEDVESVQDGESVEEELEYSEESDSEENDEVEDNNVFNYIHAMNENIDTDSGDDGELP